MNGFNPRPPITAGESSAGSSWLMRCTRFNPRPPITAGESIAASDKTAIRHYRFNPRPPITAGESMTSAHLQRGCVTFQSAPANYGGRIVDGGSNRAGAGDVSIRARQLRRANRSCYQAAVVQFQSAPANYGGRISLRGLRSTGFNPRPPITAGESWLNRQVRSIRAVSIRARQLRRANHVEYGSSAADPLTVSIRARQLRRANRRGVAHPCADAVGFNPRPPITAGESHQALARLKSRSHCFNPRPPITAGESGLPALYSSIHSMFQSAPANYGGRIVMLTRLIVHSDYSFQSAPANYGGRIASGPFSMPRYLTSFNPRPPITAGESVSATAL